MIAGKTKIIVDVRGGARADGLSYDYHRTLSGAFKHGVRLHYGVKFETMCYTA